MCCEQKPDRLPPQITGRRVSTLHQGGAGAPNEVATFRVHHVVVDFVERVCGEHEITPRLIQDLLENDRRGKYFFCAKLESYTKKYSPLGP